MGEDLEIIPHIPEDRKVSEDFDEIREYKALCTFSHIPPFKKYKLGDIT